jgi:hypothetical protein
MTKSFDLILSIKISKKKFTITKKIAKHGKQAIIVIPRVLEDIIKATIDLIYNDVLNYEHKNSIKKMCEELFSEVNIKGIWPKHYSEYGDYYITLKN